MNSALRNGLSVGAPPAGTQPLVFDGKFIRILDAGPSSTGKTRRFRIDTKEGDYEIAYAFFYPQWRKYVWEPLHDTIYEEVCSREIANFIEGETRKWRESKRLASPSAPAQQPDEEEACGIYALAYEVSSFLSREHGEKHRGEDKQLDALMDIVTAILDAGKQPAHTPSAPAPAPPQNGMDFWWEKFCDDEGHDKAVYQPPAVICKFGQWFAQQCAEARKDYFPAHAPSAPAEGEKADAEG